MHWRRFFLIGMNVSVTAISLFGGGVHKVRTKKDKNNIMAFIILFINFMK